MNTLNEGPCKVEHAWRRMHIRRKIGDYLCAKCGFFGVPINGVVVQTIRHIESIWFEQGSFRVEADLPDIFTVSVGNNEYCAFSPYTIQDWRDSQFVVGMHQYRFHEGNKWHTSLDI